MPQRRRFAITLTLDVDMDFLVHHPCTRDWSGLFSQFDRSRFHYHVGLWDHTLGKMLEEITRFSVDNDAQLAGVADDDKINGELVEKGRQL